MSVSTHVLDTSIGRPAEGVFVQLLLHERDTWVTISSGTTNADGRVTALLPSSVPNVEGAFRLTFDVGAYFAARGQDTFYATVAIDFIVRDASLHHHVPLLVSPFGYSTYRGS
jgi:5-hydroxyisourate hydrolase